MFGQGYSQNKQRNISSRQNPSTPLNPYNTRQNGSLQNSSQVKQTHYYVKTPLQQESYQLQYQRINQFEQKNNNNRMTSHQPKLDSYKINEQQQKNILPFQQIKHSQQYQFQQQPQNNPALKSYINNKGYQLITDQRINTLIRLQLNDEQSNKTNVLENVPSTRQNIMTTKEIPTSTSLDWMQQQIKSSNLTVMYKQQDTKQANVSKINASNLTQRQIQSINEQGQQSLNIQDQNKKIDQKPSLTTLYNPQKTIKQDTYQKLQYPNAEYGKIDQPYYQGEQHQRIQQLNQKVTQEKNLMNEYSKVLISTLGLPEERKTLPKTPPMSTNYIENSLQINKEINKQLDTKNQFQKLSYENNQNIIKKEQQKQINTIQSKEPQTQIKNSTSYQPSNHKTEQQRQESTIKNVNPPINELNSTKGLTEERNAATKTQLINANQRDNLRRMDENDTQKSKLGSNRGASADSSNILIRQVPNPYLVSQREKMDTIKVGLPNNRLVCYINSALQALRQIYFFDRSFFSHSAFGMCLYRLFQRMEDTKDVDRSLLQEIFSVSNEYQDHQAGGGDSYCSIQGLLQKVYSQMKSSPLKQKLFEDYFVTKLQHQLYCSQCKRALENSDTIFASLPEELVSFEHNHLNLVFPPVSYLLSSDEITCPYCRQRSKPYNRLLYQSVPKFVIVKVEPPNSSTKNDFQIIQQIKSVDLEGQSQKFYEVIGFCNFYTCHYTYTSKYNNQWLEFNDMFVKEVESPSTRNAIYYLLQRLD